MNVKYVHTNLVAQDWRKVARFYEQVFGCKPVFPERNLTGDWLDAATGIPNAQIYGIHLRLPGYDDEGPTLEVFQYDPGQSSLRTAVNWPGFGHIAFAVDDVETARNDVLEAGGSVVGEIVSLDIPGVGRITFAYVADPEGNAVELQQWES